MLTKSHAVIAVAEGAGQDLLAADAGARDASGNVKLKDIGPFLREKIEAYFKAEGIPVVMRYFDPSYQVRSRPANCEDALLCDLFARHAVHAAMAGKTGVVIGFLHERFQRTSCGASDTCSATKEFFQMASLWPRSAAGLLARWPR